MKKTNADYSRDWNYANPERAKQHSKKSFSSFYMTAKGRACHMLNNAKRRAKALEVPYSLTTKWLVEKIEAGKCEVTGLPFEMMTGQGKGHVENAFSPSLDRIDRLKGYTPDNVVVVVWIFNRARGAFPDEAFLTLIRACEAKLAEGQFWPPKSKSTNSEDGFFPSPSRVTGLSADSSLTETTTPNSQNPTDSEGGEPSA